MRCYSYMGRRNGGIGILCRISPSSFWSVGVGLWRQGGTLRERVLLPWIILIDIVLWNILGSGSVVWGLDMAIVMSETR